MCLALCLVLGVQRWKHVAVTPWWLQLSLREESRYILHNQNQRLLINESVLVWRKVCILQFVFCLAFLSCFDAKMENISSNLQVPKVQGTANTMDGRVRTPKSSEHTAALSPTQKTACRFPLVKSKSRAGRPGITLWLLAHGGCGLATRCHLG